jgi:hypothetical protein
MHPIPLLFLFAATLVIGDSSIAVAFQEQDGVPVTTVTASSSTSPLDRAIVPTTTGQIGVNPVSVPNVPEV